MWRYKHSNNVLECTEKYSCWNISLQNFYLHISLSKSVIPIIMFQSVLYLFYTKIVLIFNNQPHSSLPVVGTADLMNGKGGPVYTVL